MFKKIRDFIQKTLLDDKGKPSWTRFNSIPLLYVGMFMLIWGTLNKYGEALIYGTAICLSVLGIKGYQKNVESKMNGGL